MARLALRILTVPALAACIGFIGPHPIPLTIAAPRSPFQTAGITRIKQDASVFTPQNGLQQDWQRLSRYPGLAHSTVSALAYDITTHQTLAAIHPLAEVTPGSVTKLFTSAAALATLGPQFTYQTRVQTSPSNEPGPVYLVGGGDPWLEANGSHTLETLARQVATRVPKATQVIGVSPLFSSPTYGVGWPIGGIAQNYSAGASSLMAERSEVRVFVQGAGLVGQHPQIVLKFNGTATDPGYFSIINHAATWGSGSATQVNVTRLIGTNRIVVTGHVPQNTQVGPWAISVHNPALFAASLFQHALTKAGVTLSEPPATSSTLPSGLTNLAQYTSPTLSQELFIQNQWSINQMADNLYRELSVKADGTGSPQRSASLMKAFTAQAGVSSGRVQVDGSGLSALNQMSAQQAVQLLTYAASQPWFDTFRHSLIQLDNPHACGFLCPPSWHVALPKGTALWVKPGNLTNQWNLAGYAQAENGNLIAFAILNDGTPTTQNTYPNSAVGRMANVVAAWPRPPFMQIPLAYPQTSGTLPVSLRSLMARIPGKGSGTNVAVAVVNTANGQTVYQQNGNILMKAGLSPRIALDIQALNHLGARLKPVQIKSVGSISHGTLFGSLILNADNNNLTTTQLSALASRVKSQGISTIRGSVEYVNPTTGFQANRWPGDLPWEALGEGWATPSSLITVNSDQVTLTVAAATHGKSATVSMSPATPCLRLRNHVHVGQPGTPASLTFSLSRQSPTLTIQGTIPVGTTVTHVIAPPRPGLAAAEQFTQDLAQLNITASGPIKAIAGTPPASHLIHNLPGTPVGALIQATLARSSLASADQLIHALGAAPQKQIRAVLRGAPVSVSDWTGGGLGNYLTTLGLADALAKSYNSPRQAPLIRDLSSRLWRTESPEQYDLVGYVHVPGYPVLAVVLFASATAWNGHYAPAILSP